jgi:hypothetical protein
MVDASALSFSPGQPLVPVFGDETHAGEIVLARTSKACRNLSPRNVSEANFFADFPKLQAPAIRSSSISEASGRTLTAVHRQICCILR